MRGKDGLKIFGAGIMCSVTESVFALESASPHRVAFDLERIMRTRYIIDDFQKVYFVIDSFDDLLRQCYQDFGPLYRKLAGLSDIEVGALVAGDDVLTRGTLEHFAHRPAAGHSPSIRAAMVSAAWRMPLRAHPLRNRRMTTFSAWFTVS